MLQSLLYLIRRKLSVNLLSEFILSILCYCGSPWGFHIVFVTEHDYTFTIHIYINTHILYNKIMRLKEDFTVLFLIYLNFRRNLFIGLQYSDVSITYWLKVLIENFYPLRNGLPFSFHFQMYFFIYLCQIKKWMLSVEGNQVSCIAGRLLHNV